MQFTTLSVALFAALASAHQQLPHHFHHRRQLNTTGNAGPSTTLTVVQTRIQTITSCAPTVTDCPARNSESAGAVITEVVTLATTVCPVEQASSVHSAIISSASESSAAGRPFPTITKPAAPIGTGNVQTPGDNNNGSGDNTGSGPSSDLVLTYTLGGASSTTVITTTIKQTSTIVEYKTKKPEGGNGNGAEATNKADGGAGEPTTTISGTSTSTKYITVIAQTSPGKGAGGAAPTGNNAAVTGGSGEGECVPVTVTVAASTVTVAASTVTVTATPGGEGSGVGSDAPTGGAADNNNNVVSTADDAAAPTGTADASVSIVTVIPLPVTSGGPPYGNGTDSGATKGPNGPYPTGAAQPSGFVSKAKPIHTL